MTATSRTALCSAGCVSIPEAAEYAAALDGTDGKGWHLPLYPLSSKSLECHAPGAPAVQWLHKPLCSDVVDPESRRKAGSWVRSSHAVAGSPCATPVVVLHPYFPAILRAFPRLLRHASSPRRLSCQASIVPEHCAGFLSQKTHTAGHTAGGDAARAQQLAHNCSFVSPNLI